MTAQQLLRQAAQAGRRIRDIERQRRHLRELAEGAGVSFAALRSSPPASRVERAALRLLDLEDDLADELAWCIDAVALAEDLIGRVEDERQRRLLSMRYIERARWIDIQHAIGYTDVRSVYRLHRRALIAAEKIQRSLFCHT